MTLATLTDKERLDLLREIAAMADLDPAKVTRDELWNRLSRMRRAELRSQLWPRLAP
jgi:hypothetical protein